jgi:hypothetical protein
LFTKNFSKVSNPPFNYHIKPKGVEKLKLQLNLKFKTWWFSTPKNHLLRLKGGNPEASTQSQT